MNMRGVLLLSAMMSLILGATPEPCVASAPPLMCMAKVVSAHATDSLTVEFEALVNGGTWPYQFQWDFGDGTSSGQWHPTHTYPAGFFLTVLTVTDGGAPQQTCRDTIPIRYGSVVDYFCVAQANTKWGNAPLTVSFAADPGFVSDPEPYTWSWRFGDGDTSELRRPTHTFTEPGTYWAAVSLHSSSSTYDCYPTIRISVLAPPVAGVGTQRMGPGLRLEPPRPNPSAGAVGFEFWLARPGPVKLEILDVSGRRIRQWQWRELSAGRHTLEWDGRGERCRDSCSAGSSPTTDATSGSSS